MTIINVTIPFGLEERRIINVILAQNISVNILPEARIHWGGLNYIEVELSNKKPL